MNKDTISTIPIDFVTNIYLFCYKLKPKRDESLHSSPQINLLMKEIWTPVYCNKNYLVSNKGRVKRLEHVSSKGIHLKERIMKLNTSDEYARVSIQGVGVLRVHQVVYYSFFGGEPSGCKLVIDHINGNKRDNRLKNLQLITVKENLNKSRMEHQQSTKILFYLLAFTLVMFALSILALAYVYVHPTINLQ